MPQQFDEIVKSPLSGEEVRRIIMVKIGEALTQDCRLASHFAFPAFAAKITIAIQLEGAVHPTVERELEVKQGDPGADPNRPATFDVQEVHIEKQNANDARVDAGLDVPVLSRDEKGRPVVKGVKFAKKVATKV